MNRLIPPLLIILLLSTTSAYAELWYDSDTTDSLKWNQRIPVILNETVGIKAVNEPILLRLDNLTIDLKHRASIRIIDPQATPDKENEVGGNNLKYQINGDELIFQGNVTANNQKLYYLYYCDDPKIIEPEQPAQGLKVSWTRHGITIEDKETIWEISYLDRQLGVNRYENKKYECHNKSNIAYGQGLGHGRRIISGRRSDYFPAYSENWRCTIMDQGPIRVRINCSTNSSDYRIERTYSFYHNNPLFEVTEKLGRTEKEEEQREHVRLEIHNLVKPYFNQSRHKSQIHERGYGDNKTFYMAAKDRDNGTGDYVFCIMGKGNLAEASIRDRENYDLLQYYLHLPADRDEVTGTIRYLFTEGNLWDARLEYARFITPLTTIKEKESNSLMIQHIRNYEKTLEEGRFIEVKAKPNQIYGTRKITCRIGDNEFTLYDNATHGDLLPKDNTWTNKQGLQITQEISSREYQIECNAIDRKNNSASGKRNFLVLDGGRYHKLQYTVEDLRIRPGGTGRLYLNVTNTGDYDETNISIYLSNLLDGWKIRYAESIDLKKNENKKLFLELEVPEEQELRDYLLLAGVGNKNTFEPPREVTVEVALFEIEIDADLGKDRLDILLRDEYGKPVENAEVTVTHDDRHDLFHTDINGKLLIETRQIQDIEIEAKKTGYVPLSAEIGLRKREVSYWYPIAALTITCLTLLVYWSYRKNPERSDIENALAIALVIGILITLIWVGLVMKGKESFTAIYFAEGSYSNILYGNSSSLRYIVDCREHEITSYDLKILLNNQLVEQDEFWLGRGGDVQVMKLEREKIVEIPENLRLPAKVGIRLNAANKTYSIHYFLRERTPEFVNQSIENLTCRNGVRDVNETDTDCGGICMPCGGQLRCRSDSDCLSGFCLNRICTEPDCWDGILNHDEVGVDCGGSCMPCYCFDGVRNLLETDVDCGGPCRLCPVNQTCLRDVDCTTRWCRNGVCAVGSCSDGIQNQGEENVDCGGPCRPCPTCSDGILNQKEIDVDCGGSCRPCDEVYINEPHASWTKKVDGMLTSVSISTDGRYLVAGSNSRGAKIHVFDVDGNLVGVNDAGDSITDVDFIEDRYITVYPESGFFLFDLGARLVSKSVKDRMPDLGRICSQSRKEQFLELKRSALTWDNYEIKEHVYRFKYTPDCRYRAEIVGESYNKSTLKLYDGSRLLWSKRISSSSYSVDLASDGGYVAVGAGGRERGEANYVYLYTRKGRLLKTWEVDWNVYGLAVSDAGYVVAGTRNGTLHIFSGEGDLLWRYRAAAAVMDIDASSDGKKIVAGSVDGVVYQLTNPQPNCYDGILNQNETDVDCGGVCPPCEVRMRCGVDRDCMSGWCYYKKCMTPACDDTVQNQNEEEIDCGGPCRPCTPICYNDSMCGQYTISSYCFKNYVMRNHTTPFCMNPGTLDSYCDAIVEPKVYERCTGGTVCVKGECVGRS